MPAMTITARTIPVLRRPADLLSAAVTMMGRKRPARAITALEHVADQVIDNPQALTLLGEALFEERCMAASEAALRRSLAIDGTSIRARLVMGWLLLRQCRFDFAVQVLGEAARMAPDNCDILVALGQALIGQRRLDEAKTVLKRAAEIKPNDPWPHLALALAHFLVGAWEPAFVEYRWRTALPGLAATKRDGDRRWKGESVFGKAILLHGEQGAGDTIQFLHVARILADHGAKVWLACAPTILPIVMASEGVTPFTGPTRRRFDYIASLMEAADILGLHPDRGAAPVPYVQVPPRTPLAPAPAGTRLRIGICWAGNAEHTNDSARSCPFEAFLPLLAFAGVELVSLQVGERAGDMADLGVDGLITDLSPRLQDYGDTAAAIAGLDLVISVDTSVAHLAGAMAKPVWLLLPQLPDWRWTLEGTQTPWYPTMRLFRQTVSGDWDPVFAAVAQALVAALDGLPAPAVPAAAAAEAARLHDEGMAHMNDDRQEESAQSLIRALRLVADASNSWNNLGVAFRRLRRFPLAEVAFRRSLAVVDSRGARGNLANVLTDQGKLDEARVLQEYLLREEKPDATNLHNYGITLKNLGERDSALRAFDAALALDPAHANAAWDRAHVLLEQERWEDGWRGYEVRWSLPEAGALPYFAPLWTGQKLKGKTILVLPEQGFGDTIFALRYVAMLKDRGARVVVQCQPELFRLLSRAPWIDVLIPKNVTPPMKVDYQIACMSLPYMALQWGISDPVAGQPYLTTDPTLAEFVRPAMASNHVNSGHVNIGIIWTGSLTFRGNAFRRATLDQFLPLAADPRIRLYSLQKGPAADDLETMRAAPLVTPLGPLLTDFDATAAVLRHLDGIIMTDSSVVHLAGAVGCPVWTVLGERPYWLWGNQPERTRWYNSVTLVRKTPTEPWAAAIRKAADDLLSRPRRSEVSA